MNGRFCRSLPESWANHSALGGGSTMSTRRLLRTIRTAMVEMTLLERPGIDPD